MYAQKTYTVTNIFNKATNWFFNLKPLPQFIILAGAIIILAENAPKTNYNNPKPKPIPRNNFSPSTKKSSRFIQGNVCNRCKKYTDLWDYHHRDGDRSNNSLENCEALCPYCHAEKTRQKSKSQAFFL